MPRRYLSRGTISNRTKATMTMKLWTLAEISGELADSASQISSSPDSNLITINNETNVCHLPYVFPFTDSSGAPWNAIGTYEGLAAIALACQHLNTADGSIVPEVSEIGQCGLKFNVASFDTALSESVAVDQVIQITDRSNDATNTLVRPPCVLLGAARSAVTMPTAIISGLRGFPQMSPISTSPALDDKSQYKYFARTIPNDDGTSVPLIARLNSGGKTTGGGGGKDESQSWGVDFLAVLYIDDSYGNGFAQGIVAAAQAMAPGMQIKTFAISNGADDASIRRVISSMAESQYMYFFGILYPDSFVDRIMTAAVEEGIAGTGLHTWLFSDSVGGGVTGRNFTRGSPLERAYRGTGVLSAKGGIPGMPTYDALVVGIRELGDSPEDRAYLDTLLPKYNIFGEVTDHSSVIDAESYLQTPGLVAPFLYDAVISLGLSACELEMNFNPVNGSSFTLNGGDHYNAIVNTTFEGSSGTILLNDFGTRDPKSALFSLNNFVDDPDASTATDVQFKAQESDAFEFGAWRSLRPFIFNSGTDAVPSDLPDVEVDTNYIPLGLQVLGLILCAVIIVTSIAFSIWTKMKENKRVVKSAQPIFLYLIAAGALLMGSAIIPLSLDPGIVSLEGASRACIAMPWLLACGFSLTFSALFTKTHRILTIMRNAASFKRVKVTALDVAKPMIALLFTNVIILAIWTGIDPLRSETVVLERNSFLQPTKTENVCYSDNRGIYLGVLGVINLGALLVAFIEAYLARNISVELSESAYIMKVFFIILLVSFIGIPVIIIAKENTSAFYFVTVGIIFVVCFSILCLIFVPKIIASRKPPVRRTTSGFTRTSAASETEDEGIKILSSPKAVKELEEENRKLKAAMAQNQKEGRRMSSQQSYPSSTDDLETQGLMKSTESNGAEMDAVKEEDADAIKQKTVTIMTGTMPEEE